MSTYRTSRRRKRTHGASHFALVPFIDMMTILVVFLLAHTADVDILPNTKNIHIPQSLSDRKPGATVVVMVTKDSVFVDGKLVGSMRTSSIPPVFAPLKDALVAQNKLELAVSIPISPSVKSPSWATRARRTAC
jgi:biopolymer transport protein ExbD